MAEIRFFPARIQIPAYGARTSCLHDEQVQAEERNPSTRKSLYTELNYQSRIHGTHKVTKRTLHILYGANVLGIGCLIHLQTVLNNYNTYTTEDMQSAIHATPATHRSPEAGPAVTREEVNQREAS